MPQLTREGLTGVCVDLVDNEVGGLIGDAEITGDVAVLIDVEAVGAVGERVSFLRA